MLLSDALRPTRGLATGEETHREFKLNNHIFGVVGRWNRRARDSHPENMDVLTKAKVAQNNKEHCSAA